MAETLSFLSIICYILAFLFLITGVILFVVLRIPKTFSDYTGRSAHKKIMSMRNNNEKKSKKPYHTGNNKKIKESITEKSAPLVEKKNILQETEIISDNRASNYDVGATELLEESTVELNASEPIQQIRVPEIKLKMLDEVMFIHTDEVV